MSLQPSLPSQCPSTNSGTQSNMHRSQHPLLFRGQNLWEHFSLFLSADGPEKEISSCQGTDDYLYRCKKITKFIGGYHSRALLIVGLEGILGITTVVVVQELGELIVTHLWKKSWLCLLARSELSKKEEEILQSHRLLCSIGCDTYAAILVSSKVKLNEATLQVKR